MSQLIKDSNNKQNQTTIENRIVEIYKSWGYPPAQFRSAIELYDEQMEMNKDCKSYYFSDYQIENIQYELKFKAKKKEDKFNVFSFEIKPLLPKSQLFEFTAFVKSQYGCKIMKTRASNTTLEMHLEHPDKKSDSKTIIEVFLGLVQNKFKIRLSNYVEVDHSPQ